MERYCTRELGMHGSSEYSRRVNTRTLPGAREGGIDTRNDTSCVRQEGVEAATGTNLSCRAQLVPEVPRMFYGDGGQ